MEVIEIAELYKHIKKHFPFFDASITKVKEDYKYLRDFPTEVAQSNIDQHIMTETVTPNIAHIRGRLGDQLDREREYLDTQHLFALQEENRRQAVLPPSGWKEALIARLRDSGA